MIGVASLGEALALAGRVVDTRDGLLAAEYIDDVGMRLVCEVAQLPHPLVEHWPYYLLTETTRTPHLPESVDAAVDRRLWAYRERQSEAAATLGGGHSLDIALRPPDLDPFLGRLPSLVHPHRVFTFGHLVEGNVHIQLNGPAADDHGPTEAVLRAVADLGGSVSSEHGVGRAKPQYLRLSRTAGEIEVMQKVKQAIDPSGQLNPGVLFTSETPAGATMTAR
jgi:FAD/FMN-containing dehydrogenase